MPAVMSIDDVYSLMNYILNKNQQGNLTSDRFNLIINQSQWQYFRYLLSEYHAYQPGRPIAPVEFAQNAYIRESLTPFIEQPSTLTVNSVTGRTPYPTDYEMWDTMTKDYGIYCVPVKFIQQDRLCAHVSSYIRPIASNPVFLSIYTGFEVHPKTIGNVSLSYIRTPNTMQWNYTQDIYGRQIYDAATSQNPKWRRPDMMEIISRALQQVGVNLQAPMVSEYANQIKTIGQ